jgi:hypothetical protein
MNGIGSDWQYHDDRATSLSGTVAAIATDLVTVNLQSLDTQSATRLEFAG